MIRFALAAAAMLAGLAATPVRASDSAHVLVTSDSVDIHVNTDGSSTVEQTEIMKALDATGARMLATLTIPYNRERQSVEVLGASVVQPDESMQEVPPSGITSERWPSTEGAPAYQAASRQVVRFPALVPGSVVAAHFRVISHRPLLPGQYGFFRVQPRTMAIESVTYTLTAPASMHLQVKANQLLGTVTHQGQFDRWTYSATKLPPLVNVASTSEMLAKSPYFMVSQSADPRAVAAAYLRRIKPAENITLELQDLADVLGQQAVEPRNLLDAYYAWINDHIKLVSVPLGLANDRPRKAEDILWSRYGSVEDRIILLQALMQAKALSTDLVFVPSLPVHWSDALPVAPDFYDRLLLTVDRGQTVLDIGNPVLALGQYDPTDRAKFGFRVGPDGGEAPLQIPGQEVAAAESSVSTSIDVDQDGSIRGTAAIAGYGDLAAAARYEAYAQAPGDFRTEISRYAPRSANIIVDAMDNPLVPAHQFQIRARFAVPGYHPLTGDYHMPVPRILSGVSPMDDFARQTGAGLCQRTWRAESTTIHWVAPISLREIPRNVDLDVGAGLGRYTATYVFDGPAQTLHIKRQVTLRANPSECDPQQQAQLARLANVVRQDLGSQLSVQM